jgi:glyceraldehyde 3-phosphate dehydrogenase
LIDFKFLAQRPATVEAVNKAAKLASEGSLKGVLDIVEAPLVSSDFNHNPASASFALDQTKVIDGNFVRVMAWYDNEWGFSNRMADVAATMGKLL